MEVAIDLIKPSPYQPRLFFEVDNLKEEIQRDGLLSALVVRKRGEYYELLDGERRLRTLKELSWKTVPVDVRDVDDVTAKRSVFKLNLVRENYTTEEKAKYFKKLADEGMSFYQIGKELNIDDNWVLAHINVFRFPEDIQEAVWAGSLTIKHIQTLEPLIGANIENAEEAAREIILRKLSVRETEELVRPGRERIERARVEAAKEKLGVATPTISLETPEDYHKAADALRKEAKRRAEEAMTPEEKAALEAEKEAKAEAQAATKARREEEKRQKKAEEETRREERAEAKARKKYKGDKEFIGEALKAMPEKEVVELLDMVPIPDKTTKVKTVEEEFDQTIKMASKVVDNLDKLKREGKVEQLNLKQFSITLRILADFLDEFAKLAEGSP